jgi:ascorbate-specific PTS system EIIC-type component UlaA
MVAVAKAPKATPNAIVDIQTAIIPAYSGYEEAIIPNAIHAVAVPPIARPAAVCTCGCMVCQVSVEPMYLFNNAIVVENKPITTRARAIIIPPITYTLFGVVESILLY